MNNLIVTAGSTPSNKIKLPLLSKLFYLVNNFSNLLLVCSFIVTLIGLILCLFIILFRYLIDHTDVGWFLQIFQSLLVVFHLEPLNELRSCHFIHLKHLVRGINYREFIQFRVIWVDLNMRWIAVNIFVGLGLMNSVFKLSLSCSAWISDNCSWVVYLLQLKHPWVLINSSLQMTHGTLSLNIWIGFIILLLDHLANCKKLIGVFKQSNSVIREPHVTLSNHCRILHNNVILCHFLSSPFHKFFGGVSWFHLL